MWIEGEVEEELVIPQSWVKENEKLVLWPPTKAEKALKNMTDPTEDWRKFPLVKVKFSSGN